jgi:hypothetical protein
MNFLPNLAARAFNRHDNILFGFHRGCGLLRLALEVNRFGLRLWVVV